LRACIAILAFVACDSPRERPGPTPSAAREPAPAERPDRARAFRVEEGRLSSAALGVDKRLWVALPPDYDRSDRRYPVVYFLHGFGGQPENWLRAAPDAADAAGLSAILVMVDGDDSFYVNSVRPADYERCRAEERPWGPVDKDDYCARHGRYEDYVTRDVVAHVDARYRTRADRAGRALAGFSMGGFGALMLAMRHPDVYSAAVSHAGVDSLLYGGPRPWVRGAGRRLEDLSDWGREYEGEIPGIGDHVRGLLGRDLANWRAHDPVALAETLRDGQLALYLDCGTEDEFHFDDLAQDLHQTLERRGIRHAFALVQGGHGGVFLKDRLDDGMRFVAGHFSARTP
jgi:S-formylglutathione hydrolase FrmB